MVTPGQPQGRPDVQNGNSRRITHHSPAWQCWARAGTRVKRAKITASEPINVRASPDSKAPADNRLPHAPSDGDGVSPSAFFAASPETRRHPDSTC